MATGDDVLTDTIDDDFVRAMPFGFDSAMAIVSDVDASTQPLYEAYVGQLVNQYGLDFGDSSWLRWHGHEDRNGRITAQSLGFFTDTFSDGADFDADALVLTRTLNHSVHEYHCGNLDHFHSYLPYGPRVVWLREVERRAGGFGCTLREVERKGTRHGKDFPVMAICLTAVAGREAAVAGVRVSFVGRRGTLLARLADVESARASDSQKFFTLPADERAVLTDMIELVVEGCEADDVATVMLVDAYSDLLLDKLKYLRTEYGVSTGLVTEHSGVHFRSQVRASKLDLEMAAYLEGEPDGATVTLNGTYIGPDGTMVFSTDADVDGSFARILPDTTRDLGVRFMVPVAGGRDYGWQLAEVVRPMTARNGSTVYQARRTMPVLSAQNHPDLHVGRTWQDTFSLRLSAALDGAAEMPGGYWPLYTHLGAVPRDVRKPAAGGKGSIVLDPYLDDAVLARLSDSVLGRNRRGGQTHRVWFARASVLYDYALMRQSIGTHVHKTGGNEVAITSWHDRVLDCRLPVAPAQLYGLTFHVDDVETAQVLLDGVALDLVRNPPDESGRASVSIASCDGVATVFCLLDPMAKSPDCELRGGLWRWTTGHIPTGSLEIGADGHAELVIPLAGWTLPGAQLLRYRLDRPAGVLAAVVLETMAGERFLFGDVALAEKLGVTASRQMLGPAKDTEVAPFHDMDWLLPESAALPSHPLRCIRLVAVGEPGSIARFGNIALLRPHCKAPAGRADGFVVVGSIGSDHPAAIRLEPAGDKSGETFEVRADQQGWFCFTRIPAGIYRLTAVTDGEVRIDRRGALIEVAGDTFGLSLTSGAGTDRY